MQDLAKDLKYSEQLINLEKRMNEWRNFLRDPHPLRSDNPSPLKPSYDNQLRVLDRWQPEWIREKYFEDLSVPNLERK